MDHKYLALREKEIVPTQEILMAELKISYTAYETLQDALPGLGMEEDWKWYTPHKAWYAKGQYFWTSKRGMKKDKVLYWLYPFKGYFVLAVWFKEKNRSNILLADVSEDTKKMIKNAKTEMGQPSFPVMFKITNSEFPSDIYTLIEWKKKLEI